MKKILLLLLISIIQLGCNQPTTSNSDDSFYEDESSEAFEGEVYSDSLDNYNVN